MIYLKIFFGIFIVLAGSRFVPHPPNFTSLIALSFYVPAIFGNRYIPIVLFCFVITDMIIGFHNTIFFTWLSVLIIGYLSKYLNKNHFYRIGGALTGAVLFYLITNFGVWILGGYDLTFDGLITSYTMAIPFFGYTVLSTIIFSLIIDLVYKIVGSKKNKVFKY